MSNSLVKISAPLAQGNSNLDFETPGKPRIEAFQKLLGQDVVLLPLRDNSKMPFQRHYQHFTCQKMHDARHLVALEKARNLGVLLGQPSGDLITIDCDDDAFMAELLDLNPQFRDTLRTKRLRGGNIWVRTASAEYPGKVVHLYRIGGDKTPLGEWRGAGQTVISGQAIDRKKGETAPTAYRFLHLAPPVRMEFKDIRWPEGLTKPGNDTHTTHTTSSIPTPCALHSTLCTLHGMQANGDAPTVSGTCQEAALKALGPMGHIHQLRSAEKKLAEQHPQIWTAYLKFVMTRHTAKPGGRNAFLVEAIPFLFCAVAENMVIELAMAFFDLNAGLFRDSREQHRKEAQAVLEGVRATYLTGLSESERAVYSSALEPALQPVFRICRDLAYYSEPNKVTGQFYMSCDHLAMRLACESKKAHRLLRRMEDYLLIETIVKGLRRVKGHGGRATLYWWKLAMPEGVAR